jgi:membrane-bound ClpP family serine protease
MGLATITWIVLLISTCLLACACYIALLSRHRKAGTGGPKLLGRTARVETALEPEGAIIIGGELWRARLRGSASKVVRGSAVRIIGVSGHLLEVEPTEREEI